MRHDQQVNPNGRRTFTLLPGINIGDIGKKMGRDGIDNGYIQFTYVRVPRAHVSTSFWFRVAASDFLRC